STRKWTDKDGKDNYTTEVVASYMRNLTPRDTQGGGSFPSAQDAPAQQYTSDSKPSNVQPVDDAADDDLPF
ncbi:MAG: single-stranded DNA-binding protein, partial [Saprospiraceae bacterium]